MTLAAIAPFADKPTHIKGISHTRKQESDRVHAMAVGLRGLGVKVVEKHDDLIVFPLDSGLNSNKLDKSDKVKLDKLKLCGSRVSSFHDHRIAMSLALVGVKIPGVEIEDAHAVAKTCPHFFEMLAEVCS